MFYSGRDILPVALAFPGKVTYHLTDARPISADSGPSVRRVTGIGQLHRYAPLWPFLNWTLFGIGALFCAAAILGVVNYGSPPVMGDGWNYWVGDAYGSEHYRYSPAFLWATAPLRELSFGAFQAMWFALHLVAVVWLGPWTILLAFDDVIRGNVNVFLAVGIMLAVRGQAWTWALPLLTKVTPGVGVLYHVGRRDWHAVMVASTVTGFVALFGFLVDPPLWQDWLDSLRAGTENYQTIDTLAPLPVRLAAGAVLCLLSARWVWLLPVGMIVAMPGLWPSSFALLAAIPRLLDAGDREPVLVEARGV